MLGCVSWRRASSLKFSTVFGTVFPKRPITIRPAFSPPISMSKYTYNKQGRLSLDWLIERLATVKCTNRTRPYLIRDFRALWRIPSCDIGEGDGENCHQQRWHHGVCHLRPKKRKFFERQIGTVLLWKTQSWLTCSCSVSQSIKLRAQHLNRNSRKSGTVIFLSLFQSTKMDAEWNK